MLTCLHVSPKCSPNKRHGLCIPADGRTGHRRDDPRLQASKVTLPPVSLVYYLRRIYEPRNISQLCVCRIAPGLQQRLDHIQWRRESGGETSGQSSGETVSVGVIAPGWVHDFGYRLV